MGPQILVQSISKPTIRGSASQAWQYHSRSDSHSKIACWCVLFDLIRECDILTKHAAAGRIGFGINHVMVGPINKTLDLVLMIVPSHRSERSRASFSDLATRFGIELNSSQTSALRQLPTVLEETSADVSEVAIALEAKACMTEHLKSIPRLHAEILATGYLARKASPRCITVSYSLVNCASEFTSPGRIGKINRHNQPGDAMKVVDMLRNAIPLARQGDAYGYDVLGVSAISCANDGSPVTLVNTTPAPTTADLVHYERMIRSICSEYRNRFQI